MATLQEKRQAKYPDTKSFHYHNANPKNKITDDCVIRALSVAMDKSWDEVMTDLCVYAIKTKYAPFNPECYGRYLEDNGWRKNKQPRKDDNTKYTGKEFVRYRQSKDIRYIAHIGGNHIVTIKDSKIWDTWDSTDGCIGSYWTKID